MTANRTAEVQSRPIQPVKARKASHELPVQQGSGSHGQKGKPPGSELFPANEPLPVGLSLRLDTPVEGGSVSGREQLNRDTLLIRSQDPNFECCWFSRPLDFSADSGNPAFWMLQKTARDTWLLSLRRVSGEVASYHLNTKNKGFPIKLQKGRTTRDFQWPRTITIRQRG